jgi:ABC-type multidrug transport system fused ATPase/permease subunit
VKVWQPGAHLSQQRGGKVEDWSWAQTKRRLTALYRLARPYRARVALSIATLLGATAVALLPPYLVKLAIDRGIARRDLHELAWIVVAFLVAGLLGLVFSYAQTYFTGWTGERMLADLRNHLFRHLQRLSLGFYERNRAGVLISRLTNDVEALDQLVTEGVTSLVQNTLTLVGSAIVLFFLEWRLALAVLTVLPALSICLL